MNYLLLYNVLCLYLHIKVWFLIKTYIYTTRRTTTKNGIVNNQLVLRTSRNSSLVCSSPWLSYALYPIQSLAMGLWSISSGTPNVSMRARALGASSAHSRRLMVTAASAWDELRRPALRKVGMSFSRVDSRCRWRIFLRTGTRVGSTFPYLPARVSLKASHTILSA